MSCHYCEKSLQDNDIQGGKSLCGTCFNKAITANMNQKIVPDDQDDQNEYFSNELLSLMNCYICKTFTDNGPLIDNKSVCLLCAQKMKCYFCNGYSMHCKNINDKSLCLTCTQKLSHFNAISNK